MKFLWNNNEYEIDEGSVYIKNFNETLDSATIRISQLITQLNLNPLDKCVLSDELNRLNDIYMCIDTFTETMTDCTEGNEKYSYEISLFSETKLLEGIICPNLTITRSLEENPKSILYYINEYLNLYSTKIYGDDELYKNEFIVYDDDRDILDSIDCPEMMWNQPTLREILDSLYKVLDWIPVVKNGIIGHLNLSEKKSQINTNYVNYITRSKSAEDSVSELYVDFQNIMQTGVEGIDNTVNRCKQIPFTVLNDIALTTDNLVLDVGEPILKVKKLTICFAYRPGSVVTNPFKYLEKDITKYVYEKQAWDILPVTDYSNDFPDFEGTRYQQNTLYYVRGEKTIDNWCKIKKSNLGLINWILWEQLIHQIVDEQMGETTTISISSISRISFRIEYETTADALAKCSKSEFKNNRVIPDNQSSSYINSYLQGDFEYQKANRLGNDILMINARFDNNYIDLFDIGQTYNDNIIYQVQYQIYKNHIEVNAQACKDYVLQNYFTSVNSKVRTYEISTTDMQIRHDLFKLYCVFNETNKPDTDEEGYLLWYPSYLLSPCYTDYSKKPVDYVMVKPKYEDNENWYILDLSKRIIGDSIVCTFGFNDNYKLSNYLDNNGQTKWSDGGIPIAYYSYTDQHGNNNGYEIKLLQDLDSDGGKYGYTWPEPKTEIPLSNIGNMVKVIATMPLVDENQSQYSVFDLDINRFKDSREITRQSIQFEFLSNSRNIYFTKEFIRTQKMLINQDIKNRYAIYTDRQGENPILNTWVYKMNETFEIDGKLQEDASGYVYESYPEQVDDGYPIITQNGRVVNIKSRKTFYNGPQPAVRFQVEVYEIPKLAVYEGDNWKSLTGATELSNASVSVNDNHLYISGITINPNKCYYITRNGKILVGLKGRGDCYLNLYKQRQ